MLRKKIDKLAYKYNHRTGYTCSHNGSKLGYLKWNIPRDVLNEYIDVLFEGDYYPVPKDYEKCLKIFYGNSYMELPPESKRITHRPVVLNLGVYKEKLK